MGRFLSAVVAAVAIVLLSAGPATADRDVAASCGDTITSDAYLAHDLKCAPGAGLTLEGAATLNLGGHRLIGQGANAGSGITLTGSGTPTIRNGVIESWDTGVAGTSAVRWPFKTARFERVTFTKNAVGVRGENSLFAFTSSRFVGNREGFVGNRASATIEDSIFRDNSGTGAGAGPQSELRITDSTFIRNGVAVHAGRAVLRIAGSLFVRNEEGISVFDSPGSTFRRNDFIDNGTAYSSGSRLPPGGSIDEMIDNRFTGNDLAVGAGVSLLLRGNSFTDNKTALLAGSEIGAVPGMIRMKGNRFTSNSGDAVYIEGPAQLKDTVATRNGGHGIYAPQAVDRGGNVAYLNGAHPQCTGVVCLPR